LERLLMRLGPNECGQKRMMNVDDRPRIALDKIVRKHLHVARQHHQIDLVSLQKFQLLRFRLRLVLFADRNLVIRHAVEIRMMLGIGMVADHQGKVATQLAVPLPVQQVHQAVVILGNKNGHARPLAAQSDAPVHSELVRDWSERFVKLIQL
jgi:hypothetical protein